MRRAARCLFLLAVWLGMALPVRALAAGEPLNMGFYLPAIREANLADVRASLQFWAEEVGHPYALTARVELYDDMSALRGDMLRGKINLVVAPGMEIAEAFGYDDIANGFVGVRGTDPEGLALVIAVDSGVERFADLRSRRVLHLGNDRLAQVFLGVQCMRDFRAPCQDVLRLGEEKRDVLAIHKVFFGQADAALVSRAALHAAGELNPQVRQRLRVIAEWRVRSLTFGLMNTRSSEDYRARVQHSALEVVRGPRGRQILELFRTDHMESADRSDLRPYWQLLKEYKDLTRTISARKK
jgi:hypothetical protein